MVDFDEILEQIKKLDEEFIRNCEIYYNPESSDEEKKLALKTNTDAFTKMKEITLYANSEFENFTSKQIKKYLDTYREVTDKLISFLSNE